jgi:hypothetical protein
MAGLSYLQAFVDSNKRMGRILANGPLLARSKPPMSVIGIDRSNYLSGLVAFYEIGDTSLLANAIARGLTSRRHRRMRQPSRSKGYRVRSN